MAKFEKGRKKTGGRKSGAKDIPCLNDAVAVYEKNGGQSYLEEWISASPLNKRRFIETILAIALKQVTEKREVGGSEGASAIRIEVVHLKSEGGNGNGGNGHAEDNAK